MVDGDRSERRSSAISVDVKMSNLSGRFRVSTRSAPAICISMLLLVVQAIAHNKAHENPDRRQTEEATNRRFFSPSPRTKLNSTLQPSANSNRW